MKQFKFDWNIALRFCPCHEPRHFVAWLCTSFQPVSLSRVNSAYDMLHCCFCNFFFFVDWIVWRLSVPLRVSWPISSWNWSRKAFTLPQFSHVVHWGLVHDSGNLNPQLFPSGYGFCPQVSGESGYFLISSLDWKIINPQRLRVDRNIFESGKKKLQIKNRYACTTVTATTTII